MDPGDARDPAEPPQHLFEPIRLEPHARVEAPVTGGHEERPRGRPPVGAIGGEGVGAAFGEGHDAVPAALALARQQAALRQTARTLMRTGRGNVPRSIAT